jgi:hypothetical protein
LVDGNEYISIQQYYFSLSDSIAGPVRTFIIHEDKEFLIVDTEDFFVLHVDSFMMKNYEILIDDSLLGRGMKRFQMIGYVRYVEPQRRISSHLMVIITLSNEKIMNYSLLLYLRVS